MVLQEQEKYQFTYKDNVSKSSSHTMQDNFFQYFGLICGFKMARLERKIDKNSFRAR